MTTCGHQFQTGDDRDWLMSSSAVFPINGSTSATKILKNLIETHCKTVEPITDGSHGAGKSGGVAEGDNSRMESSFPVKLGNTDHDSFLREEQNGKKTPELFVKAKEMTLTIPCGKEFLPRTRFKSEYDGPIYYNTKFFDEEQHLDGCPIKWYFKKKNIFNSSTISRRNLEEYRKPRCSINGKKFRDRIPLEVKIGKLNLHRREYFSRINLLKSSEEMEKLRSFEIDQKTLDIHKKKLEAKLNWRPFQDIDQQDSYNSPCDKGSSMDGYLRPRPITGGKLPISILLFPYHQSNGYPCGCVEGLDGPLTESISSSCLNSDPVNSPTTKCKMSRPKTTNSLRLESKSSCKKLQLPNKASLMFDTPRKSQSEQVSHLKNIKRPTEAIMKTFSKCNGEKQLKTSQSLSSLCYELEDKLKGGHIIDDEYLEKMIRKLSVEDNLIGMSTFLKPRFAIKKNRIHDRGRGSENQSSFHRRSSDDQFKITCKKVKFSQRPRIKLQ